LTSKILGQSLIENTTGYKKVVIGTDFAANIRIFNESGIVIIFLYPIAHRQGRGQQQIFYFAPEEETLF
jgi:hypothetical protein